MHSFFSRFCHFPIPHRVAGTVVALVAMTWSSGCVSSGSASRGAFNSESKIHVAAKLGDLEKVKALLKGNPDLVFSKDNYGNTPLHEAASNCKKDVAELLLANKADVNAKNNVGMTPLHEAAVHGCADVAELLLANGAEVNPKITGGNLVGFTPLGLVAYMSMYGHPEYHVHFTDGSEMIPGGGRQALAELLRQHGGHE